MTTVHECCVCYSTSDDIDPALKNSFITIPCEGNHVVCFSCFMQNANTKCPMCRFNYKTMEPDNPIEEHPTIEYPIEVDYDIAFINEKWIQLKHCIDEMIILIRIEVFGKGNNCCPNMIPLVFVISSIHRNKCEPDDIHEIDNDYSICCRMYLAKMLVAYNDMYDSDYTNFIASVNDYIQHEYDAMSEIA